jgi:hypothetical protein
VPKLYKTIASGARSYDDDECWELLLAAAERERRFLSPIETAIFDWINPKDRSLTLVCRKYQPWGI